MYPSPTNRALCSAGISAGGCSTAHVLPTRSRETNTSEASFGFTSYYSSHVTDNLLRADLNSKFGGPSRRQVLTASSTFSNSRASASFVAFLLTNDHDRTQRRRRLIEEFH
jgi:hypothetical protein